MGALACNSRSSPSPRISPWSQGSCHAATRGAIGTPPAMRTVSLPKRLAVTDEVAEVFEHKHRGPSATGSRPGLEELGRYTERAMAYMIRLAGLYALADKRPS